MLKFPWICILGAMLLIGCGGGDGGSGTGGGNTGGLTETSKIAFIESMGVQMNGWRALPRDQRHTNLVAWAKQQSMVQDAGIAPETDNVWVLFTDGDGTAYVDNKIQTDILTAKDLPINGGRAADLPVGTKAYCIYSFNPNEFPDDTGAIEAYLDNYGYSADRIVPPSYPTIATIRNLNGAGVIFWQTHGWLTKASVGGSLQDRFCLLTGETASAALHAAYKPYRDAGEVLLSGIETTNADGSLTVTGKYAITNAFVSKYLRLGNHALVGIDACTSGHNLMGSAWNTAQAGTYVGWSDPAYSRSGERFRLMFDRLLGANQETPISTPRERPFSVLAVERWMQEKGFDNDPSGPPAKGFLKWFHRPGSPTLALRPTIWRVFYEGKDNLYNKSKFLIEGDFGPDPGAANREVTWGGKPLEVADWNELEGIRVKLIPPYPSGSLRVRRGTRESDLVPMTEWNLPMTYTLNGQGSLKYVVNFTLKIRVDARGARFFPQDVPVKVPLPIWNLDDSGAMTSASGQYQPDPNTTITWSGDVSSRSFDMGDPNAPNTLSYQGQVNLSTGKIEKFYVIHTATYTRRVNGANPTERLAHLDGYFQFDIPFNTTTFAIPFGQALPTQSIGNPEGVSATLTWGPASPSFPPTSITSRGR